MNIVARKINLKYARDVRSILYKIVVYGKDTDVSLNLVYNNHSILNQLNYS